MNDAAATDDNTGVDASNSMDIDDDLADGAEDDDESFNLEDIPSDDISTDDEDLEYVNVDDEAEYVVMKPKGYTLNVEEATLGEESKELLLWRETDSFSDWTIKVVAEGDENAAVYSVHRSALAMGPKKSGFFEAAFKETSERMSTVKLSQEVAAHFPQFLDYMYSHPVESKAIVSFANWKSMACFANRFHVSRLTEDVMRFIEKDLYDLDHMEHYLSLSDFDGATDDFANRILDKATRVCAEMILSIQVDSSLLRSIPKTMFYHIMSTLVSSDSFRSSSDEDRDHVHGLMIEYLKHIDDEIEDEEAQAYFDVLMSVVKFRFFHFDDSTIAVNQALEWLQLMKQKEWDAYAWLVVVWTFRVRKNLHLQKPGHPLVLRVVERVPNCIVAKLLEEALLWRRALEVQRETRSLRFKVTLIREGDEADNDKLHLGELELPTVTLTEKVVELKRRLGLLRNQSRCVYDMTLTHNGVRMDEKEPLSTYPITQENNLIEVEWLF